MAAPMTIFPADGEEGAQRARAIAEVASGLGYEPRVDAAADGLGPLRACLCDAAVVFDLSVAGAGSGTGGRAGNGPSLSAAYRALTPIVAGLQHILLVSTGYLPLNVMPLRRGGAPAYPYPRRSLPDGRAVEPVADTAGGAGRRPWVAEGDASLLEWTREQLTDLAGNAALPSRRCGAAQWRQFTERVGASDPDAGEYVFRVEHEMIAESRGWHRDQAPDGQVFVSYRGGYWAQVEALASDIRAGRLPGVAARPVRVVRPGELALERELLSEGRRWMIVSLLDDMLRASRELWVYRTGDYLESWWTLAELAAAAYIDDGEHAAPVVSAVDPASGEVTRAGTAGRISLTEADRGEIARFMANSRPDTMSPELAATQRLERLLFRAGLGRPYLWLARKALSDPRLRSYRGLGEVPGAAELTPALADHLGDPRAYRARLSHRSHLPRFWDDILLDRGVLDGTAYRPAGREFIDAPERMIHIGQAQAAAAVRGGGRLTARDGTPLRIAEFAPRYLWRPARMGGMIRGGLQRLPAYHAVEP